MSENLHGSCLCGSVTYRIAPPYRTVIGCHCVQCRKQTGHFMAASAAKRENFTLVSEDHLTWYTSGPRTRRGFCGQCGSTLFFEVIGDDQISFTAGTVNGDTGLTMTTQIFAIEKGDYYALPQDGQLFETGCAGVLNLATDSKNGPREN